MSAQVHERLRLDGILCSMACELWLPKAAPGLVFFDKEDSRYIEPCSACWRGYIGFWEISRDRLYLRKVIGNVRGQFRPSVVADWYSGVVRVVDGRVTEYVHSEFGSRYERETFFDIQNGVILRRWIEENEYIDPGILSRRRVEEYARQMEEDPPPKRYLP